MTLADLERELSYGDAPESPKPVLEWLDRHGRVFGHWIAGTWVHEGPIFTTSDPSTNQELAKVHAADAMVVNQAVAAAQEALTGWQALSGFDRGRYLYAIGRLVQKHSRLLAVLESLDNGKPIRESRDLDVPLVARHFTHHAGWAQLLESEHPDFEPVGVCGQIIPWNFPLLMLAWKIAPALACGNTVVLKPAELTPLTAVAFAEICEEAGLPLGVVNIVQGGGETGRLIVDHAGIQKVAFTGSTEVGREIRRRTAGSKKTLSLELGGKSPYIVFPDADIDSAVEGLVDAIWFNQGQVCCAGSRLLVQEGIAARFHTKLKARMQKLRVGSPLDKAIDIGAIVSPEQRCRIEELIETGAREGGEVWRSSVDLPTGGCFLAPTLITGVSPSSTVAQQEIFGPVLVSMTFRTPDEAVELANNTAYGLAASVWSQDIDTALDISKRLHAGTVWINSTNLFDAASGFGGYKESGFGREGGREGLFAYLKPRPRTLEPDTDSSARRPAIDRTLKLFVGGKQVRPDSGYSEEVEGYAVPVGNRKDIRNAVESASAAAKPWAAKSGHERSQILQFLGENLIQRRDSFAAAPTEVDRAAEEAFFWAAWADKYDGLVHSTPGKFVTLAMNEPYGVTAIVADGGGSLVGLIRTTCAALAMGNTVVMVPSRDRPLPAFDLVQVMEISDIPSGCWNLVSGPTAELAEQLAQHEGVDAMWCFESSVAEVVENQSAGNLKPTWVADHVGWPASVFLRQATRVKNIWVPYGA
ncbi:MAG: NAD/NADP-dependent betaine aldehyde dehydrogenase [Fimbriimonadaceae bacterium]|nr:NAD/NADP-dependent betaine aldehyde dehydrogenase [Fimbriimonadaceae bacterium]